MTFPTKIRTIVAAAALAASALSATASFGDQVTPVLKTEGFDVLTSIDVQDTFKKRLEVDSRRYVILGACNPALGRRALDAESQIELLLPCNVVVRQSPQGSPARRNRGPLGNVRDG